MGISTTEREDKMNAFDDAVNKGLIELESLAQIRNSLRTKLELILSYPFEIEGYYQAGRILDSDLANMGRFNSKCAMFAENFSNRLN